MDMQKISAFLSELRRQHGYTQQQLGERLGVTNKTVSRWETGIYLPPADMLLELSELYDVSINELLSGKRLGAQEFREAAEQNLRCVVANSGFALHDRIAYFKKKWLREHIGFFVMLAVVTLAAFGIGSFLWGIPAGCILYGLCLPVLHAVRHNTMMAYVEAHVFDGVGS